MLYAQVPRVFIIKVLLLISVTFLFGCATTPPNSGFLSDYSKLQEDRFGDPSLKWWEKEVFNRRQYKKLSHFR